MVTKLSDYQRHTLVKQCEAYGDHLVRLVEERTAMAKAAHVEPTPHVAWLSDQAAEWYEVARVLSTRQGLK